MLSNAIVHNIVTNHLICMLCGVGIKNYLILSFNLIRQITQIILQNCAHLTGHLND